MLKKIVLSSLLFLAPFANAQAISGLFKAYPSMKVYLQAQDTNYKYIFVDSTMSNKEGKFAFSYKPTNKDIYYVMVKDKKNTCGVILDKGKKVVVKAENANIPRTYVIENPDEENKVFRQYIYHNVELKNIKDSLMKFVAVRTSTESEIAKIFNKIYDEYSVKTKQMIKENPTLLANCIAAGTLDIKKDVPEIKLLIKNMQAYPYSSSAKTLCREMAKRIPLENGVVAPEINLPDVDGKAFSTKEWKGKMYAIMFWGSWCEHCRADMPNVVKLYNKYKDKGFEILSVAIDKDKAAWQNAIKEYNMTWKNVSDLKEWKSAPVEPYHITGTPYLILVDAEGKVVKADIHGREIEQKLIDLYGF